MEALYHIDNDCYLSWYIAKPLSKLEYCLESYFTLWKNSYKTLLLEQNILVAKI